MGTVSGETEPIPSEVGLLDASATVTVSGNVDGVCATLFAAGSAVVRSATLSGVFEAIVSFTTGLDSGIVSTPSWGDVTLGCATGSGSFATFSGAGDGIFGVADSS